MEGGEFRQSKGATPARSNISGAHHSIAFFDVSPGAALKGGLRSEYRTSERPRTSRSLSSKRALDSRHIAQSIELAKAGQGSVIAICGGMGTGKTTLLNRAADEIQRKGLFRLQASGLYPEMASPFALAKNLFASLRRPEKTGPDDGTGGAEFAPEVRLIVDSVDGGALEENAKIPPLLDQAIDTVATSTPTLIVVDSCQWADKPSLQWLTSLSWRIGRIAVVMLIAVDEGEPCADAVLLDQLQANSAHKLMPAPLDLHTAASVIEERFGAADAEFVAECVALTGGNPMLLTALSDSLAVQGITPVIGQLPYLAELEVASLAPMIRAKLLRVAPQALTLAQVVAILGANATLDRVAGMVGAPEVPVAGIVAALQRMGLLVADRNRMSLAHPLLRKFFAQQLTYAALQALHRQAARVIDRTKGSRIDVAEHLVASAPSAEPWAVAAMLDAAYEALRIGDPGSAVAYLDHVLKCPLSDDVHIDVMMRLGTAEAYINIPDAIRHLSQPLAAGGRLQQRLDAAEELATLLVLTRPSQASLDLPMRILSNGVADSAQAFRAADDPAGRHRAARLAELCLQGSHTAASALTIITDLHRGDAGTQARTTASAGNGSVVADSLRCLAYSWNGQNLTDAVTLSRAIITRPLRGPQDIASHLRAGLVLSASGEDEAADEHCRAVVATAASWQHIPGLAAAYSTRSAVCLRRGRLPDAVDSAREGLRLLDGCSAPSRTGAAILLSARLIEALVRSGRLDEARDVLDLTGLAETSPLASLDGAALLFARGALLVGEGRYADAARDLLEVGRRLAAWQIRHSVAMPWRTAAAWALHQIGAEDKAQRLAAEEVTLARGWGAPGPLGRALMTQGRLQQGRQRLDVLAQATSALAKSAWDLELASSLVDYGLALHGDGRDIEARRHLKNAYEVALRTGVTDLADKAKNAHRAAGGRLRTGDRQPSALSAAELRVATLAVQKRTNREIAAALFVTQRVVEIHLSRSYHKLGISSRKELPEALQSATGESTR